MDARRKSRNWTLCLTSWCDFNHSKQTVSDLKKKKGYGSQLKINPTVSIYWQKMQ